MRKGGYYLVKTGIPVNFGVTVLLGFLVGTAIAGQTFYLFTVENIRQFGALKAMGTGNGTILLMVLSQALNVGLVGYGVGVGLAAVNASTCHGMKNDSRVVVPLHHPKPAASVLSVRKVLVLDPAIVFRG